MHVCIRPWTATYAPAIVEALSDAGVTDNLRDGLPSPTPRLTRARLSLCPDGGEGHTPSPSTPAARQRAASSSRDRAISTAARRSSAIMSSAASGAEGVHRGCEADMPLRLCRDRCSPRICRALCGKRRLLPSVGEGWLPAEGRAEAQRRQKRRGARYAAIFSLEGGFGMNAVLIVLGAMVTVVFARPWARLSAMAAAGAM